MMKFNFGYGPLVLKGTSRDGYADISITLNDSYDEISEKTITDCAEKLYSNFGASSVGLFRDDILICEIQKEKED